MQGLWLERSMGIKFHCPNGHKLNVKSFLSGKKAICPKCGAKVIVPSENPGANHATSGGGSGIAISRSAQQALDANDSPEAYPAVAVDMAGRPAMQPVAAVKAAAASPSGPGDVGASPVRNSAPLTTAPQPIMPTVASAPTVAISPSVTTGPTIATGPAFAPVAAVPMGAAVVRDAIDEAPNAVWYVRPPSGGQFGPAAGEIMRAWINEGRVTATSLVWRAGWPEWRSAAATFPKLAATLTSPAGHSSGHSGLWPGGAAAPVFTSAPTADMAAGQPLATGVPMGTTVDGSALGPMGGDLASSLAEIAMERKADPRARRRSKKGSDLTLTVSIVLIVLAFILVAILAYVLSTHS